MKELEKISIINNLLDNVDIISGKFFNKKTKVEIKNIKQFIAKSYRTKHDFIIMDSDLKAIVSTLYNYGDAGIWYDVPIVAKAKELGPLESEMAFDLTPKQLLIINRIVFHPMDEVMFIATGIGGSGKSTFLNILKQIYDNDCSSASLSDLSNGFTVAEAVKCRLICSDELAKGELNLPILKQLISKQSMYVNPKGITGYEVKTQSSLFYCCNKAPVIDVTDSGILRRIVFYERNTKIKNPDVTLKDKKFTEEELIVILRNALRFERSDWFKDFKVETHKYLMANSSVHRFQNCFIYSDYKDACFNAGLKPYSEPNWREIRELFVNWEMEDEMDEGLPF